MKTIILTSSRYGTAAHHITYLIESKFCEISMVILSDGVISNKNKYYRVKFEKQLKLDFWVL